MALAPGTILGRYEVERSLGVGGMGEVYLALDTSLNRRVAIKLLPAEFSQNPDRLGRFKQEALAVADINHPNIAHIYEIGEAESGRFMAMEYVDGVTLTDKIHREKASLKKLLKYLGHAADALAKAHAAGIVHAPTPQASDHDPHAPADLQRILRRCLAKDPEERFQSIKDVAIELRELRDELGERSIHRSAASDFAASRSTASETHSSVTDISRNLSTAEVSGSSRNPSSAEFVIGSIKSHKAATALWFRSWS